MLKFLSNHPHGFYKFLTVYFTVFGVVTLATALADAVNGGRPIMDPLWSVLAFWWAWDAWDNLRTLRWYEYEEANRNGRTS